MKRIFVYIVVIGAAFILYACPMEPLEHRECTYEYPLNITNFKDSIKITDTLWIEHDFDPHVCLDESVYKNGKAKVQPHFLKLIKDTLIWYAPIVINYSEKSEFNGQTGYTIMISEQNGRYKSAKYGIVFPDTGIYLLSRFYTTLENDKDNPIWLNAYFNTVSNNDYLLPANLLTKWHGYANKSYHNSVYFVAVVE
jgi:hypothetical protein